ncbi:macroglobulin / complement [Holotrichia oblita]|uniref:Macroglobulin / complement n=1 Tax=Holotrichia oblita TaxID=644536 RepID=A0ACB9TMH4_HOLOL|nr:macroglobulin / complement [Holotrichia oblita]
MNSFQNLDNLLVVPTGCGEQTMATLTPNLYVLQYLQANNALTKEIKEKILKNLEIGYQRMLTYVHNDGSFSAFGENDKQGSMFLTAFVIRTFRQMKQYIFIDDDVVKKAINWIVSHQLENGCFDPMLHLFHEMGLASAKNQTTALTSYVLISILETNTQIDNNVLTNAKKCIINDVTIDKYTLAISSYALGLLNLTQEVKQRLDKLMELAETSNGLLWWKQSDKSLSSNVEVSSYVLISLLHQDPVGNLGTASLIVRWLQSQMNPSGAFYCTTDTVVGLDAISRYAILVNKKQPHVKIILTTKTDERIIEITKRDRTKTEVLPLSVYPNQVKAKIQGDGCVSIQTVVNYYLDTPIGLDNLHLDIEVKPVNQKLKCSLIELKPCVSYTALGQINMAIVEVNMPSGYAANEASLYELITNARDKGVKKFELRRNQVILYLTQLGSNRVCLPFKIEENLIVENVANGTVKFYDYYNPEASISKVRIIFMSN